MAERFRVFFDRVVELVSRPSFLEGLVLVAVVATSVILAGVVYGLFSGVSIGVAFVGNTIRVFYPDQRVQTVAELLVATTFYLLGFAGLM
ncbi:MAG: hypothetical protein QXV68_05145, partial [Candidatus Caldarchaeum sp.]